MKQLIVMIATIILGIAIAFMIIGFKSDASKMTNAVSGQIDKIVTEFKNDVSTHGAISVNDAVHM